MQRLKLLLFYLKVERATDMFKVTSGANCHDGNTEGVSLEVSNAFAIMFKKARIGYFFRLNKYELF